LRFTLVPGAALEQADALGHEQDLWGGWVIEGAGLKIVHTGDMGYSQDARDIGERLGPFDLAFIPIGAVRAALVHEAVSRRRPEAIQVRADLRAVARIGMHWGTFEHLTDEPLDEPPAWLARERGAAGSRRRTST
jgi:L-ascorbate metabolism protein UlaG (beta-lactamase superfamily)